MKNRLLKILVVLTVMFLISASIVWAQPAPVAKTGQTTSYQTGDDGDLEKGVAWPSPRFTANGDGTVNDNLTGLVWIQNARVTNDPQTWQNSLIDAALVNALGGYGSCGCSSTCTDWRLPNVNELQSLLDFSQYPKLPPTHPFTNVLEGEFPPPFWTSTTLSSNSGWAYTVTFNAGETKIKDKSTTAKTWLVRGGN